MVAGLGNHLFTVFGAWSEEPAEAQHHGGRPASLNRLALAAPESAMG